MRVLLSIPSLLPGGAERQFAELAAGLADAARQVQASGSSLLQGLQPT